MFGNKAKHALAAAQAENAQLKARADILQGELATTQARCLPNWRPRHSKAPCARCCSMAWLATCPCSANRSPASACPFPDCPNN